MATVYSPEVEVGTYNRIRIKCDYSGTSATLTIQFRRSSSYTTTWADSSATLTFNGTTKDASYSYTGTVGTSWVDLRPSISGYTVSASGDTYNWNFYNNASGGAVLGCSGTLTVPAQGTAPTKPTVTINSLTNYPTYVNVTYGTTSFGDPSTGTVYLYGGTSSSPTTQIDSKTTTGTSTFKHDNLTNNTKYYYRARAYNGVFWSSYSDEKYKTTKAAALASKNVVVTGTTSVRVDYTTAAGGNEHAKNIQYRIGSGEWTTGATVNTGSATSGSFNITGLTPGTQYTFDFRVNTSAGSTSSGSITRTTYKVPETPTVSGVNNTASTNAITFGTSSFNTPPSGYVYLYGDTNATPTTQLSRQITVGDHTFTHGGLTGNTAYYYRSMASNDGGDSDYSTVVRVTTKSAAPTITILSNNYQDTRIQVGSPVQGSFLTMTLHAFLDGVEIINQTITSGNSTTYSTSLTPGSSHTVTAYITTTKGDSTTTTVTFTTTQEPQGLYGPVSGNTKRVERLYGSLEQEFLTATGFTNSWSLADSEKLLNKIKEVVPAADLPNLTTLTLTSTSINPVPPKG